MALGLACVRYVPRLLTSISARRLAYLQSEPAYFRKLEAACRTNDRVVVYRALCAWARAAGVEPVSAFARRSGRPALEAEIERLSGDLFSGRAMSPDWNAGSLLFELANLRKASLAPQKQAIKAILPELNPYR